MDQFVAAYLFFDAMPHDYVMHQIMFECCYEIEVE